MSEEKLMTLELTRREALVLGGVLGYVIGEYHRQGFHDNNIVVEMEALWRTIMNKGTEAFDGAGADV